MCRDSAGKLILLLREKKVPMTTIGKMYGISRERVRQVELKALRKLRNLTRKLPSGI